MLDFIISSAFSSSEDSRIKMISAFSVTAKSKLMLSYCEKSLAVKYEVAVIFYICFVMGGGERWK